MIEAKILKEYDIVDRIAAGIRPPKCPRCGRGLIFPIREEDREIELIEYRCRGCFGLIASSVDDAIKFMKGEAVLDVTALGGSDDGWGRPLSREIRRLEEE